MTDLSVSVVVATFGEERWSVLANERAVPSAEAEGVPTIHIHGDTLHEARNTGLAQVETEWVCWLDADDSLEPGYFAAMGDATGDLRAPSVKYVRNARYADRTPVTMPRVAGHRHACTGECLAYGNFMVIGTVARTALVRDVGGFRDFGWSEDWDLWVRCWQAGATIEPVPVAVYRAFVSADSRNRGQTQAAKYATHQAIARANGLPVPGVEW